MNTDCYWEYCIGFAEMSVVVWAECLLALVERLHVAGLKDGFVGSCEEQNLGYHRVDWRKKLKRMRLPRRPCLPCGKTESAIDVPVFG